MEGLILLLPMCRVHQPLLIYNAFVPGCGWSTEQYKAWAYQTLTQLLAPVPAPKRHAARWFSRLLSCRRRPPHHALEREHQAGAGGGPRYAPRPSPASRAAATASARVAAGSLASTIDTWLRTVFSASPSARAMRGLS